MYTRLRLYDSETGENLFSHWEGHSFQDVIDNAKKMAFYTSQLIKVDLKYYLFLH